MGNASEAPASTSPEGNVRSRVETTVRKKVAEDKDAGPPGTLKPGDNVVIHDDAPGSGLGAGKVEADVKPLVEAEDFEKKALAERRSLAGNPRTKLANERRIKLYLTPRRAS
jgi:hypothetical protein